jgi:hypothetical protein
VYNSIHPEDIATEIEQPDFIDLIQQFIFNQQHPDHASSSDSDTLGGAGNRIAKKCNKGW